MKLSIEYFILTATGIVSVISVFYIPKTMRRLAVLSFFTIQAATWASINILVQTGAISYPTRIFVKATRVGFIQISRLALVLVVDQPDHSVLCRDVHP